MQSCFLPTNNGRLLETVGGVSLQLTSEEGSRMLKEWPRKEKEEKIKWHTMEERRFCELRGWDTMGGQM